MDCLSFPVFNYHQWMWYLLLLWLGSTAINTISGNQLNERSTGSIYQFLTWISCYCSERSKSPRRPVETGKYANVYNELTDVGLPDDMTAADLFSGGGASDRGAIYAHHCCAAWNECVLQAEDYSLQFVDKAALVGLTTVSSVRLSSHCCHTRLYLFNW